MPANQNIQKAGMRILTSDEKTKIFEFNKFEFQIKYERQQAISRGL